MSTALALIDQEKAHHAVSRLCRVLGVPRASYYAWKGHRPSPRAAADQVLTERIRCIHRASRGTYGAPRIHAELRLAEGIRVGRKRVARLLRRAGLQGRYWRRRRHQTTRRDPKATAAADLVAREFTASRPDALWMGDFTELQTGEGVLYVAALIDGCSRVCVGWSMRADRTAELVVGALGMAVARRDPAPGLVHHSDHGSQYTSLAFTARLAEVDGVASMGSVGDALDNAACESFFGSLKLELLADGRVFATRAEARVAVFEWIECWYNPRRRHSTLRYLAPLEYEQVFYSDNQSHPEEVAFTKP
jgi:putative transposase